MKHRILKTATNLAKASILLIPLGCSPPDAQPITPTPEAQAASAGQQGFEAGACGRYGSVETELFGSLNGALKWTPAETCAGMVRPVEVGGVRLRFTGRGPGGENLVLVLGLAPPTRGNETRANVTLIVEDEGLFFSNQQQAETCWARLERFDPPQTKPQRVIRGLAWCVTPLPAVAGNGEIRIGDLTFAGQVPWPTGGAS